MDGCLNGLMNSSDSKTKPITHTLMNGGSMHIPEDKLPIIYKKIVKYGIEDNQTIQLVEKMGQIHPFIVDIDIKYNTELSCRQYTQETIINICSFLWARLQSYLDLDDLSSHGQIWITEKESPYPCPKNKDFVYKDGIHIIFPNILIKRDTYKCIMNLIQEEHVIETIFNETCNIKPDNKPNTLMDSNFSSWQPYGCSKPNESPYKLTQILEINDHDIPIPMNDEMFEAYYSDNPKNNLSIAQKMSVSYCQEETVTYSEELLTKLKEKGFKTSSPNSGNMVQKKHVYGKNKDIDKIVYRLEGEELNLVTDIVKCLSKERASDYGKWVLCGMCLHNINDCLIDAWKEFSSKSDSYDEEACDRKWPTFKSNYEGKLSINSGR